MLNMSCFKPDPPDWKTVAGVGTWPCADLETIFLSHDHKGKEVAAGEETLLRGQSNNENKLYNSHGM